MTGMGSFLTAFSTTNTNEKSYMTETLEMEIARMKFSQRLAAIKAKNDDLIKNLKCNQ
jgi:hypothetical protein